MEDELLTKPATYNFEDSNIALLGSDLEKRVREQAGEHEPAWEAAEVGQVGTLIWRIEKFQVKPWPKERYGQFFSGDSYIVLHTYKKKPDSDTLSYDLHFWLGEETTADEAGTAAYKTAELDDVLHGTPVQYREVMGHESHRFLSYFKRFVVQRGGIATGFHHYEAPPPESVQRLYRIHAESAPVGNANHSPTKTPVIVREVDMKTPGAIELGDAYVLDKGDEIWQLNTKGSVGKEKYKAAEFAKSLSDHQDRGGTRHVQVYDEGTSGANKFFSAIGIEDSSSLPTAQEASEESSAAALYRLSDANGQVIFSQVQPSNGTSPTKADLVSSDTFLVDFASHQPPVVYLWIGSSSSAGEKRLALQYAQKYLHEHNLPPRTSIIKVLEGSENDAFFHAIGA